MKNTAKAIALFLGLIFVQSCEKETTFLITETSIGPMTQTTKVSELESVFAQDSVVMDTSRIVSGTKVNKIEIFEKGGKHLLSITPDTDSIQGIENVRIMDPRYVSDKGIGLKSTFAELKKKYPIKKIVTTLNSVVIFPKESNLYFTLDKEELPGNLRFTMSNIEEVQIPDEAKLKYLMLGWE
ncbi:MAG: hypothetical protein VXW38_04720 [Bacteroidota bacterium]|nr:hypothetical protein [Bacteroidota bacterium]